MAPCILNLTTVEVRRKLFIQMPFSWGKIPIKLEVELASEMV
jgi:hypothetical protein